MSKEVIALKSLIGHQILKDVTTRPRVRSTTLRIEDHDQDLEMVIGGGSDVSYAVVSTSINYVPPVD